MSQSQFSRAGSPIFPLNDTCYKCQEDFGLEIVNVNLAELYNCLG